MGAAGQEEGLERYEDSVLAIVPEHGGRVVQRIRSTTDDANPREVQIFQFPSQGALDAYILDPRRTALADERDRVVARTELFPVDVLA